MPSSVLSTRLTDRLGDGDNFRHCRHARCVEYEEHIIARRNFFRSGIYGPSDRMSNLRERHHRNQPLLWIE